MSSIRKNFLYNTAYQLLLIVLPLITTPYVSRVLGAEGVGVYSYTYTVANYFMLIAMLGVKNYGNRSIAAVRDDPDQLSRTFWEIYWLQLLCSLVALVAYLTFALLLEPQNRQILLIQSIYVFTGMLDISWLFFGLEKFKLTVVRNIAVKLLTLAAIFLLVRTEADLWRYALILALGTLISQSYLWLYVRRFVAWSKPSLSRILHHLPGELVLFIPVVAVSLYKMMDKIMLRQMSSFVQVGFYESSEKILNIPTGIITALGTVMLPRMSNLAAKAKQSQSLQYIRTSMSFAMFLACGMAFGIAGIAPILVPVFLGEGYAYCIDLLQILSPTVLFLAWANVIRTQYLIPQHHDRSYIISVILGALVNLVVNALLIPRMAANGAAIGTVCAEAAVCLCQTLMVRKDLPVGSYLKEALPFLLLGLGMYSLLWVLTPLFSSPLVALVALIVIGGGAYTVASGLYYILSHPDVTKSLIRKLKRR
ncbi:MAG: flippase [Oscillospiraceae bacterium]|nr:flippase [Oscillospiraceae bacterium]